MSEASNTIIQSYTSQRKL